MDQSFYVKHRQCFVIAIETHGTPSLYKFSCVYYVKRVDYATMRIPNPRLTHPRMAKTFDNKELVSLTRMRPEDICNDIVNLNNLLKKRENHKLFFHY